MPGSPKKRARREEAEKRRERSQPANKSAFTVARARNFLATLAETAMVGDAAASIGVSRQTVYNWRAKHEQFAADWDEALRVGMSTLEDEGVRRARDGVLRPVFYQGEECGVVEEYSDSLLQYMLSAHNPRYNKQRLEHSGLDGGPIKMEVTQRNAMRNSILEAAGRADEGEAA